MINAMVAITSDILDRIEGMIIPCACPVKTEVTECLHTPGGAHMRSWHVRDGARPLQVLSFS